MSNVIPEENVLDVLTLIKSIEAKCSSSKICEFSDMQIKTYRELLNNVIKLNGTKSQKNVALTAAKGKSLEDLVNFLITTSGGIFSVEANIRTGTNEIDQIIKLTTTGDILLSCNLIDSKLSRFISECKNYGVAIGVPQVGKFCSVLETTSIRLGILFSYKGVSGKKWENASGLIKKFYLCREKLEDRFCIIDFNKNNFQEILDGGNLLEIISRKLDSLQFDTDYKIGLPADPVQIEYLK